MARHLWCDIFRSYLPPLLHVQVTTTFIRWHPADVIVCVLTWLTGKDSADTSSVTTSRWAPSETSTNSFPSESALEMQVSIVRKSADITFWELIGIKPHCRHLQHKCKKVILRFFLKFLSFVTFFCFCIQSTFFLIKKIRYINKYSTDENTSKQQQCIHQLLSCFLLTFTQLISFLNRHKLTLWIMKAAIWCFQSLLSLGVGQAYAINVRVLV